MADVVPTPIPDWPARFPPPLGRYTVAFVRRAETAVKVGTRRYQTLKNLYKKGGIVWNHGSYYEVPTFHADYYESLEEGARVYIPIYMGIDGLEVTEVTEVRLKSNKKEPRRPFYRLKGYFINPYSNRWNREVITTARLDDVFRGYL